MIASELSITQKANINFETPLITNLIFFSNFKERQQIQSQSNNFYII